MRDEPESATLDDIKAVLETIADDVSEIHDKVKVIAGCAVALVIGIAIYAWKHNLL